MQIDKPIEYESNNPKDKVRGIVVFGLIIVAFSAHFYLTLSGSPEPSDWLGAGFFVVFITVAIAISVWSAKKGLRYLLIKNTSITLTYPNDKIEIGRSQVQEVKTRKRKDNGQIKGSVNFKGSDGNKYSLRLSFNKPGGEEAFAWFQALEQEQQV